MMYISLKALTCSTLGTLLLLSLLSETPVAHARSLSQRRDDISTSKLVAAAAAVDKRDILGGLIPTSKNGDPSSPASVPAAPTPAPAPAAAPANPPSILAPSSPPPAPAPEKKDPEPAPEPVTSSPQKTPGGPGLVEQLLGGGSEPDSPKHESSSSSPPNSPATSSTPPPATSADHKKKPTQAAGTTTGGNGSSRTDDDSSPNGGNSMTTSGLNGDQDPAAATSGVNSNNKNATTPKEGLSSGIVAMIILIVLGILVAILLSCYRIRQSRVRRKEREECWDENILKNHVGTVGYNGGTNGSISGGSNGVGSIDVKSEALGDGGCHGATVEAAYAGRGSLGGSSLRDNQSVAGGSNVYGTGGGTYSPYSQHAHTYSQGYPQQQQQQQQGYGGGGYGGTYY